ncbi:hypothetical protein RHECNPAF_1330031 [Rhizobium etli CNPAF512]|nr:hypothetical protein RHECNPAF_1330031 [Rhizobium etli CNPAF512]
MVDVFQDIALLPIMLSRHHTGRRFIRRWHKAFARSKPEHATTTAARRA